MSNSTIRKSVRREAMRLASLNAFGGPLDPKRILAFAQMPFMRPPTSGGAGGGGRRSRSTVSVIPSPPTPPDPPVPPPDPPVDPLTIYSDEMTGPTINPLWTYYREDLISVMEFTGGMLHLGGAVGGVFGNFWFNQFIGYLLGPIITGDFIMQARIQPRNIAGDGPPPASDYRLGGISMHDPDDTVQNFAHIAGGYMVPDAGAVPVIESKNNQNDVSHYIQTPWPLDVFTIYALQRVGQAITFASRLDGDPDFTVQRIVDRNVDGPPFPDAMHAALHSYSDQLVADVSILVDWVRFSTPGFNGGLILPTS